MKNKKHTRGYLDKMIEELGFDEMKRIYNEKTNADFCKTYHCSTRIVLLKFGYKRDEQRKFKQKPKFQLEYESERNLNTERWEIPEEDNYWIREGFEIRQPTYITTKLLCSDTHS